MFERLAISNTVTLSNTAPHTEVTLTTTNEIYCQQTMQSLLTTVTNAHSRRNHSIRKNGKSATQLNQQKGMAKSQFVKTFLKMTLNATFLFEIFTT